MARDDFREARARIEKKDRPMVDKRVSVEEAVRLVRDGDHVAIGGCLFSRTPMALVREIIRQGRKGLTLSRNLMCYEGELLIVAGCVEQIMTSWFGIGLPWGISRVLREYVQGGKVRYEEWSHLGMGLRYRAGAMGVPFLPTFSMLGSDLLRQGTARTMACPFTGETLCLVPAAFPDVAVLHAHRADRFGNVQIDGYRHMDADIAQAAATVLVTAEEIMGDEEARRSPDRTAIPFFLVDAVVEVPFGAYPHECYGLYEADFPHFDDYVAGINAKGMDGVRDYLQDYVYGSQTFEDYLGRFGVKALLRQRQYAREVVGAP